MRVAFLRVALLAACSMYSGTVYVLAGWAGVWFVAAAVGGGVLLAVLVTLEAGPAEREHEPARARQSARTDGQGRPLGFLRIGGNR